MSHQPHDYFADILRVVARWLAPYIPPKSPLKPKVLPTGEESNMLTYSVTLPPAGAPDVVKRELSVTIDGVETIVDALVEENLTVKAADNAVITLKVRDTDDAENVSEWGADYTFTATDTIAPPPPGAPGATLVGEE